MKNRLKPYIIILALLLVQCKSSETKQVDTSSFKLSVLLTENITPNDLNVLQSETFTSKRSSRTENRWLLSFESTTSTQEEVIKSLKGDDSVLAVSKEENASSNDVEVKSGKSKPIKN